MAVITGIGVFSYVNEQFISLNLNQLYCQILQYFQFADYPSSSSSSELAVPGVDEEASVEIVEDRIVEDTMVEDRIVEDRIVDTSGDTGCVEIVEARGGTRPVKIVEARGATEPVEIVEESVVEAGLVEASGAGVVEACGAGEPTPACSEEVADLRRKNAALEAQVLVETSSVF